MRRTVASSARLPASLTAERAVSAVMCVLTERLTSGEAHHVLQAVPFSLAPLFERCVAHRDGRMTQKMDHAEFMARVADHLGVSPAHAELICSAVFNAVRAELPAEVSTHVARQLPHGLKDLWLGPPVSAPDLDVDVRPEHARAAIEHDLERRAHLPAHVAPATAFVAVMCTFARRLSGGEARHVLLGLPRSVRALIDRCATHEHEQADVFGRDELLRAIGEHLSTDREETERITLEVLRATKRALAPSVNEQVAAQLPPDLAELWERALPAHEI